MADARVVGPGGTSGKSKAKCGTAVGPGGAGGGGSDMTTKRGYEARRTQGLRSSYKETGGANNSKA